MIKHFKLHNKYKKNHKYLINKIFKKTSVGNLIEIELS